MPGPMQLASWGLVRASVCRAAWQALGHCQTRRRTAPAISPTPLPLGRSWSRRAPQPRRGRVPPQPPGAPFGMPVTGSKLRATTPPGRRSCFARAWPPPTAPKRSWVQRGGSPSSHDRQQPPGHHCAGPGLCWPSHSEKRATSPPSVLDAEGSLRTVGHAHASRILQGLGDLIHDHHTVAALVGIEELRCRAVAAPVTYALVLLEHNAHLSRRPRRPVEAGGGNEVPRCTREQRPGPGGTRGYGCGTGVLPP